jgi:hypothetical protein
MRGQSSERNINTTIGPKELKRLQSHVKTSQKHPRDIMRIAMNHYLNDVTKTKMPLEVIGKYANGKKHTYKKRTPRAVVYMQVKAADTPGSTTPVLVKLYEQHALTPVLLSLLIAAKAREGASLREVFSVADIHVYAGGGVMVKKLCKGGWLRTKRDWGGDHRRTLVFTTAKTRHLLDKLAIQQ